MLAIDPGPVTSGAILIENNNILDVYPEIENHDLLMYIEENDVDRYAIEMIASYGMPVGKEVFETAVWIGRFIQAIGEEKVSLIYRKEVCLFLCNSVRAKDANVRQAIIDLYPGTGGGKTPQIGTKKHKGPLYHVKSHAWAALGVALTANAKLPEQPITQ